MVKFNELKVVDNCLVIDISVIDDPRLVNVYLRALYIENQNTFIGDNPSQESLYIEIIPREKSARIVIPIDDIIMQAQVRELSPLPTYNDLFFIYVYTQGDPTEEIPCNIDRNPVIGVTINMKPFYEKGMNYITDLANTCNINNNFINYILQWKAFELALKTCNYEEMIYLYNKFFNGNTPITNGGCGCGH